ncbi:hypothetical protein DL98DRAFT_520179 [Cadophora sp. DSE1049]|nr:hypothetical protein DL98DRAFT_520179 [Cadophora sp. DSE1049]
MSSETTPTPAPGGRKKWADEPFKLLSTPRAGLDVRLIQRFNSKDLAASSILTQLKGKPESGALKNATEMALIHNVLLRGLNSIYNQATALTSQSSLGKDISDFLTYCTCWSLTLRSHHGTEETVYFPLLESMLTPSNKGVAARNHSEHERFLSGLGKFDLFVQGVQRGERAYDGIVLRELVDRFAGELVAHLKSEVEVLVGLEGDGGIDWDLLGKTMAGESKRIADRTQEVPFLIVNADVTYEGGIHGARFPPFPWFVGQIFRWWYIPQLKGAWRFASCDDYGMPKELPFA